MNVFKLEESLLVFICDGEAKLNESLSALTLCQLVGGGLVTGIEGVVAYCSQVSLVMLGCLVVFGVVVRG